MKQSQKILIGAGIGAAILWAIAKKGKGFGELVPGQKVRGQDAFGSGAFKASRDGGTREHNGVDIVTKVGQPIKSPVPGRILRYTDVYNDGFSFAGVALDTADYLHKIFYLAPTVNVNDMVEKGQIIGYNQDLQWKYPGITPHVHWEVWDKSKNNVAINPLK